MLEKSAQAVDILNTQLNAEEKNNLNSSKLVEITDIENTPFKLVKTESGCFIGYGNNRLTELMTEEEALKKVEEKNWDFIGTFIISVITSFDNYKTSQQ